jgi:hypothetical protein
MLVDRLRVGEGEAKTRKGSAGQDISANVKAFVCQGRPIRSLSIMALMQEGALPLIQLAVTPVILITGLGSLLLTMTNRLGRVVDRTRILAGQVRTADTAERSHLRSQLRIMYRRAKLVRLAVTLAATSMFISGLLVVVIFFSALLGKAFSHVIVGLFVTAVLFLLGSLAAFIRDIFLSLVAVGSEVDRVLQEFPDAGQTASSKSGPSSTKSL